MQKLKQELNANAVGANCIRPHFEGMTQNKGITLIALIITIIVMLILVGVTINVALNGGLFQKAETATRATEEKAILEEMLAMMEMEDNGKFKPDTIIGNMRTTHPEYEIDDSNKPNVTIKGKLGTYNYIVSETEIKIGTKENITSTIWQQRGLTSSNIKYDTIYYGQGLDFKNDEPADRTLSVGLYSNGDFCLELDGAKPTSKLNSSGDGNYLGTNGVLSDEVDYYMSLGGFAMCDNGFKMPISGIYFRYSFTNSNTVNIYIGTAEDLDEDGNVPETTEFFAGTLYELDL